MQPSTPLISGRAYTWLVRIVVALAITIGLFASGWYAAWQEASKQPLPERIDAPAAFARMLAIRNRATSNPNYSFREYVLDAVEITRVHRQGELMYGADKGFKEVMLDHLKTRFAKQFDTSHLGNVSASFRQEAVNHAFQGELMKAMDKYGPKWDGKAFTAFAIGGLWFVPVLAIMAFVICLLRILAASQTWEQAATIAVMSRKELVGASLWWPLGLSQEGYNPAQLWKTRVSAIAWQHRHERQLTWGESESLAEAELLTRGEALVSTWRVIWGANWKAYAFRPWTSQWRSAAYLSLVAVVYVTGGARTAHADEEAKSPLSGLMWHYGAANTRFDGATGHLFLFFRDGTTAIFLNQGTDGEAVELSHRIGTAKWGPLSASIAPYATVATGDPEPLGYGLTGFLFARQGDVEFSAPGYLTRDMTGNWGTLWPDTRLLVKAGSRFDLGVGATFLASETVPSSLQLGPLARYRLSDRTSVLLRYTRGLSGLFKGQDSLRLTVQMGF